MKHITENLPAASVTRMIQDVFEDIWPVMRVLFVIHLCLIFFKSFLLLSMLLSAAEMVCNSMFFTSRVCSGVCSILHIYGHEFWYLSLKITQKLSSFTQTQKMIVCSSSWILCFIFMFCCCFWQEGFQMGLTLEGAAFALDQTDSRCWFEEGFLYSIYCNCWNTQWHDHDFYSRFKTWQSVCKGGFYFCIIHLPCNIVHMSDLCILTS